jgi:hypothetical protein
LPDIEITLEANPGTFEQEKFVAYRKLGINRLSIGIQSFQQPNSRPWGASTTATKRCAPPAWRARPGSTTSTWT